MLSANDEPTTGIDPTVVGLSRAPAGKAAFKNHMETRPREGVSSERLQHIWIITGPAGCGKTTVAKGLEKELGLPFLEGDDFHPQSNKDKMGNGIPLTDADRWDWLISLRDAATEILSPSPANNYNPPWGVIMSCSALKHKYRDVMRVAAYDHPSVRIHFIYLRADESVLMERVSDRESHYMKSSMVHSQVETLEDPSPERDVLTVDVAAPPDEVQRRVSAAVAAKLAEYEQQ